ncbi:MAG: PHP domain-containing protein [Deltaproteobacteria bacterium]|nr:PHP domain-containing protein [Deltaproteobacteria bacterium]MBW1813885.1 PHP domain-containing protein [Deltaproteobacteria bacterium]MBW1847091.1 PHP domain-containing protein [Deltaproteobacteria bacterium]MBW2365765.1 PHP domain-containing protein [Deltaproteobacteria bacterium]
MDYNTHAGIDLHIHSNASDGTFSPEQILDQALDSNLAAIAITDHDTINGSKEALRIGPPPEVEFLTGVEISANPPVSFPCSGSFHILGYAIDLEHPALNQMLEELQQARKNRNPRILQTLNELGFPMTMDEVESEMGDGQMGRPHIAKVMIKKGYAKSINEVFDKYLGKDKPAYVDKYRMESDQAIELISNAGGIPVLAHPGLIEPTTDLPFENLIKTLTSTGLKGIEVYYPEHSPESVAEYSALADRHGLLMTGGTDFHGALKPDLKMGFGKGDFFVPYELYEKLMDG